MFYDNEINFVVNFLVEMATILNNTTSKGAGSYIGETKRQLRDGENFNSKLASVATAL